MSLSRPSFAVAMIAALSVGSCAYLSVKQSLSPQLTEVRSMRAELDEKAASIQTILADVENEVNTFGAYEFDGSDFDSSLLRDAIVDPMDADISDGSSVGEASGARAEALTKAAAEADAETRATVDKAYSSGRKIHDQLTVKLPSAIEELALKSGSVAFELGEIKAAAEGLLPVAQENPLMSDADMQELRSDYDVLNREIADLTTRADALARECTEYTFRTSLAMTKFQAELDSLGGDERVDR